MAPAATRTGAPAAAIVADAVLVPIGVVGMAGTEGIDDAAVILAALVLVADDEADGCAGGLAFEHAGQDFDSVGFLALRNVARSAGLASVQLYLQIGLAQLQPRRATIHYTADSGSVRFAERSQGEQGA